MKIGLVAGESSGDLLGAGLIRALKGYFPDATFEGIAGPEMVAAGCEQWESAESLTLFGLTEPLVHLPRLLRLRKHLVKCWTESPPDVFVGIDAPDFNLALEMKLRAKGIKTVHYVSPSVWAWRAGRIKTVKAAVDKILCILPFEESIYKDAGVDAIFVGHPKADSVPENQDMAAARKVLGLTADEVVAILPGSRASEVSMLGGTFIAAAKIILDMRESIQFVIPVAKPTLRPEIEAQVISSGFSEKLILLDGNSEQAMIAADLVLLASGTAALESALLEKPTIAAYRLGRVTYAIFKGLKLLKLSKFTLPNLLTKSPLVPEFIQNDVCPTGIADAVIKLLDDPDRRQFISDRFARLRNELALNTDQRAADAVISLLK
jgi:lipid-A-disaccharide synthase